MYLSVKAFQTIKLTIPYIKWHIVNIKIGTTAIIFFLSMAKNKKAKQGSTHKSKITITFVTPL